MGQHLHTADERGSLAPITSHQTTTEIPPARMYDHIHCVSENTETLKRYSSKL